MHFIVFLSGISEQGFEDEAGGFLKRKILFRYVMSCQYILSHTVARRYCTRHVSLLRIFFLGLNCFIFEYLLLSPLLSSSSITYH